MLWSRGPCEVRQKACHSQSPGSTTLGILFQTPQEVVGGQTSQPRGFSLLVQTQEPLILQIQPSINEDKQTLCHVPALAKPVICVVSGSVTTEKWACPLSTEESQGSRGKISSLDPRCSCGSDPKPTSGALGAGHTWVGVGGNGEGLWAGQTSGPGGVCGSPGVRSTARIAVSDYEGWTGV